MHSHRNVETKVQTLKITVKKLSFNHPELGPITRYRAKADGDIFEAGGSTEDEAVSRLMGLISEKKFKGKTMDVAYPEE